MAINSLQIPGYGPSLDITPQLSQFAATINQGVKQRTLADIGRGISDGTLDYRAAAGKVAGLGDLNETLKFLALAEAKDKQGLALAASKDFNDRFGNILGPNASSAAVGQPATVGLTVPNDANAFPGQAGMDLRLADRTQDFIQDFPNTSLSSGFRTRADQQRLYDDRANNSNPVARPGTSNHERGMAADISGMTPEQREMLPQYGLSQPYGDRDPPHVELAPQAAPVQVAQAGGSQGLSIAHVPMLLGAIANPNLPAAQKDAAKMLLTRALDEAK
ncbi:MAG: D-alanyl-D-alanine carboxypeptidase family protein, partial [Rhizobiales bacterium]|nr:D-alanyl-D-alanine carboxypeptidase family protein [Hyphomicrobiales bacterium]